MNIFLTSHFKRAAKKLHSHQTQPLKNAIAQIQETPTLGELKIGDLAGVRVYKFRILHQLILLAYIYEEQENKLTLLDFGPHGH